MVVYFSFLCKTYKYVFPVLDEKPVIHKPKCARCRWILDGKNTTRNALKTRWVSIYAVWLTPLLCDIIYNKHKFQLNSNHTVYIKEQKWNDKYIHYWWIKIKKVHFIYSNRKILKSNIQSYCAKYIIRLTEMLQDNRHPIQLFQKCQNNVYEWMHYF